MKTLPPAHAPDPAALHLIPRGLLTGAAAALAAAGTALPLAGGPTVFTLVELAARRAGGGADRWLSSLADLRAWAARAGLSAAVDDQLARLSAPRPPFAGLSLDRPRVMGIVNVTPDSFSDGGDFHDPVAAIAHGRALLAAGADILDIGGESTRPGAPPVPPAAEIARVVPVVRALAGEGALISVDTRHAAVMAAALEAGARIFNDVSALEGDGGSLEVAVRARCPVILMHMRGEPATMQQDPVYDDAALDVMDYLRRRVAVCVAAGIPLADIAVDPGIGFGKTVAHNTAILNQLTLYHGTGCVQLMALSRKRFIAALSRGEAPRDRLAGSLTGALAAVDRGAQIVRVHDVAETVQALAVWRAVRDC